jgi:hypothetical protein
MRSSLRLVALSLAVFAAGCTNGDKPSTMGNGSPAGPNLKTDAPVGGCSTTLGDRVWYDTNCNGIQDKDETGGPEGLKVSLLTCPGGDVVMTTATDNQGGYQFTGVAPGSYKICIEIPGGFGITLTNQGNNDGLDNDFWSGGCTDTDCFTVECDKPNLNMDAGLCEKKGQPTGCRFTGGGNSEYNGDEYTFGGQAGANTALPPQPAGEWEHNQHDGPDGDFAFHGGTHSAPDGTYIDHIVCEDDGYCKPARHAPAHQLDFWGIGQFHAAKNLSAGMAPYVIVGESLHWFEVNIDDAGEPGKATDADCPPNGFGLHGDEPLVNCDCGDYYRITIHQTAEEDSPVIYMVQGYFTGNFQIHPLTGFDGGEQHPTGGAVKQGRQ